MANKNQHFGELEYCFGQYFSRYCAPVITKDYNYYQRKQQEEYDKAYNEDVPSYIGAGSVMQTMVRVQAANIAARSSGKWSKMNLDNFIDGVVNKIVSNKNFQKDWGNLIDRYRESLIAKLGTKGYVKAAESLGKAEGEKYIDPAVHYGQIRFMELVKLHLARVNMPKSSIEYILKETANSSLMFTLGQRFMRARDLSPAEEEVHDLGNKLYNPSKKEKASAFVFGAVLDAPALDGVGSLAAVPVKGAVKGVGNLLARKGIIKAGSWLTEHSALKVASKASYVKGLATSAAIDSGVNYWASSKVGIDTAKKSYSKTVFGNEDTIDNYQKKGAGYKRNGTEYISNINDGLGKKIKVGPMRPHVSNTVTNKDSNHLLTEARGNSRKLLKSVATMLSSQALPYKDQATIPGWMLHKTSKQCRAFSSSFLSMAKQMSEQGLRVYNINGKNMTLAEVSQRAGDYAKAAVLIDQANAERKAARAAAFNKQNTTQHQPIIKTSSIEPSKQQPIVSSTMSSSAQSNTVPYQNIPPTVPQETPVAPSTAGWGPYLDNAGLNGFGDITKNLGYVIAMLPDMLINMFTGKNQNFRMENNILPIASIFAAMFVKNPLIKMLMVGLGGASLLKSAGTEVLSYGNPNDNKVYKKYLDEPLNSRLSEPAIKGSSLFVDIDNIPMVINISKEAAIAYRDGHLPLNTLANSVLVKYDQQKQTAETNYIINETAEKDMERQVALR